MDQEAVHVDSAEDESSLSDMQHVDTAKDEGKPLWMPKLKPLVFPNNGCSKLRKSLGPLHYKEHVGVAAVKDQSLGPLHCKEYAGVAAVKDESSSSDMDLNSGNPLFITDLDPLICQNNGCSNPLKVPIRQCLSGHLFCFNCHHGHLNCMLCPEKILFPAPSMDAIINAVTEVCPNKIRGCNEKFPFYELEYHVEKCCNYSDLTCPIPHCSNRFGIRHQLEKHLTRNHKTHVDSFRFGVPTHFAFNMCGETRILIESKTRLVFVVHYAVGCEATLLNFFCVNFCDGLQYTYKITNRRGRTTLLADTPVPVTTFKEGAGAMRLIESLPHDWRTGKSKDLDCKFVIDMIKWVPKN